MSDNKKDILIIQSDLNELGKVETFFKSFLQESGIPEEFRNNVLLCSSEGVVNAIEHGNKGNKDFAVTVRAVKENKNLCIYIKDEGEGFEMDFLPDPTKKENILKEEGRGIYIIKQLSNCVTYQSKNNCLKIEFSWE